MFRKTGLIVFFLFLSLLTNAQKSMHVTEQLLNGTIRIEAVNGKQVNTGTGFFFNFLDTKTQKLVSVIITNKHVVSGSATINLFFKKIKDGEPDYTSPCLVSVPVNPANSN